MDIIEKAFEKNDIDKLIDDYTQFQTKIFTSRRGGGKTFKIQKKLINNYVKHGRFFAVIRESQIEVDNMLTAGFWDNNLTSKEAYKRNEYEVKGNKICINGKIVGIAIALTTYGNFRGVALNLGGEAVKPKDEKRLLEQVETAEKFVQNNIDKLTTIFFDEFEPISPKLSSENRYKAYLHICETLFRFRKNVTAYLCANLEKSYSVFLEKFYFPDLKNLEYGIKKSYTRPNKKGKIEPLAVWAHIKSNEAWEDLRDNSYVGKLERGRDSGMFTTGSAYLGNKFKKIDKPIKRSVMFNITNGENALSFWRTEKDNLYYVTEKTKGTSYITYCFDIKKAVLGVKLIRKELESSILGAFERDEIEFDSSKSFSLFVDMLPRKTKK